MKSFPVQFILLLLLSAGCRDTSRVMIKTGRDISVPSAMIVSAHPEASGIGAEIMAAGGNAVDAAAAAEFALAVCFPTAGNIGGGGFMVIRLADGSVDAIDYREKAPERSDRDMYLDEEGIAVDGLSLNTHLSAGIPGTVDGVLKAHKKYGLLTLKQIIQPAIDLAHNGFPLTEKQAASLNSMRATFIERNDDPVAFVRNDPWKAGDTLRQPDLGKTLERIRDNGRDGFYSGETARLIVSESESGNGIISAGDLANYNSVWREPLTFSYRDFRVISMPPPSSGGVVLSQLLKMTEMNSSVEDEFLQPATIHFMVEAERRAFADRAQYLGDPDFVEIPVEKLLDREYLAGRMKDFRKEAATPSLSISYGKVMSPESEETTHYSVVDKSGNAVAGTTTLNNSYGSAIVVNGAGFILNDEMDDFSIKPGTPNMYGLLGGEANAIAPGKRMLSSMTPTILEKDGKLFLVVGSPGGSTIITTVYQIIRDVVDFRMSVADAVNAPRFHHQWLPDVISYEEGGLDSLTLSALRDLGHTLSPRSSIGRVDAILIGPEGMRHAGADPRGDDAAAGW